MWLNFTASRPALLNLDYSGIEPNLCHIYKTPALTLHETILGDILTIEKFHIKFHI